jgi:ribose transport system substrate-binding protein
MFNRIVVAGALALATFTMAALPASAQDSAGVERARKALEPYQAKPAFKAPGDPFDARQCASGKKMLSIPNNSSNPFV